MLRRQRMTGSTTLRWGRIAVAALVTEAVLIAVAVPLFLLSGEKALVYAIPPAALMAIHKMSEWRKRVFRQQVQKVLAPT